MCTWWSSVILQEFCSDTNINILNLHFLSKELFPDSSITFCGFLLFKPLFWFSLVSLFILLRRLSGFLSKYATIRGFYSGSPRPRTYQAAVGFCQGNCPSIINEWLIAFLALPGRVETRASQLVTHTSWTQTHTQKTHTNINVVLDVLSQFI